VVKEKPTRAVELTKSQI